jgi:pimeloyl-ACP methyl ester carboxylesterase
MIGLSVVGALAVAVLAFVAFAVARELGPLTGAALEASPEAKAYAAGEARLLESRTLPAVRRDIEIESPPMRVHGFEMEGAGTPILFIHGGGSSEIQWLPLLVELRGRRAFIVDRPGCGLSDGFDYTDVDVKRHATEFVGSVLDALHLERAIIVGNSMGGLWAIDYALAHGDRVAGLVLVGTPAVTLGTVAPTPLRMLATPGIGQVMTLKTPSPGEARERLEATLGRHAAERLPADVFDVAQLAARIPGARQSFRLLARATFRDGVAPSASEIARLAPPVLWIWGDRDVFADPGFPTRARAALPGSEVLVLEGAGHCPWLDDAPAVARSIAAFVDGRAK